MKTAIDYDNTPGQIRLAIVLEAETPQEIYDIGRVEGMLQLMQAPGGTFTDDGIARLTLVLYDEKKTKEKSDAKT